MCQKFKLFCPVRAVSESAPFVHRHLSLIHICAYNRVNGEPCCGSKTLLTDILRNEWHFKGHVLSDCFALRDFYQHHMVTKDAVESAALAMNNGCDLNCGHMYLHLSEAVSRGMVSESRLRAAVTNLYTTRLKLGMEQDRERPANPYDKMCIRDRSMPVNRRTWSR